MTTINPQVTAGANDAKSGLFWGDGNLTTDSSDLWIGNRTGDATDYSIIIRVIVNVEQGANIDAAHLVLYGEETDSTAGLASVIWGVDADNPAMPADYAAVEALTHTTATVAWTNPAVTANTSINTPSLATIIQEIVDRQNWVSGNAMILVIENNGSSAGVYRSFLPYEASTTYAPTLHIEYTEASSGITGTLSVTIALPTIAAAGAIAVAGALSSTVALPTLSASGGVSVAGALSVTIPIPTLTATGAAAIAGTLSATIPIPTISATGGVAVSGSLSATVPIPSIVATGTVEEVASIHGALDATIPAPTLASTGAVVVSGTASNVVPIPTLAASGAVAVTGIANNTIPVPALTATGTALVAGTLNVTIPAPTLLAILFIGVITTPLERTFTPSGSSRSITPSWASRAHTPAGSSRTYTPPGTMRAYTSPAEDNEHTPGD